MLRITYTPTGGESRLFELNDPEQDMTSLEAELIEDSGGRQWGTYFEWMGAMTAGSFRAVRVFLWILLRRDNPKLNLDALEFPMSALVMETIPDPEPAEPSEPEGKGEPGDSDTNLP